MSKMILVGLILASSTSFAAHVHLKCDGDQMTMNAVTDANGTMTYVQTCDSKKSSATIMTPGDEDLAFQNNQLDQMKLDIEKQIQAMKLQAQTDSDSNGDSGDNVSNVTINGQHIVCSGDTANVITDADGNLQCASSVNQ